MALEHPERFAALVRTLREQGVSKLGPLELGPPVHTAPKDTRDEDPHRALRHRHDVMFAATSVRPPFVAPRPVDTGVPAIVVQRRARNGARDGEGTAR